MKFIKKSLWAALALTLAAPAYAAMEKPNAGIDAADGSSFILNLIDVNTGKSATFDLGSGFSVFNPTNNYSWNLTGTSTGANYNSAFTAFQAATGNAGDVKWGVFSGQQGPGLDTTQFYSTYTAGAISNWTSFSAFESLNVLGGFSTMMDAANNELTHATSNNGANFINVTTPADENYDLLYAGGFYGVNGDFGLQNPMVSGYNTSLNLYKITSGSNDDPFAAVVKTYVGAFNFTSAGLLTFAANPSYVGAVPEADTTAMMMAGLGLMGFIARRRKQTV